MIAYRYKNSIYLNITNACTMRCFYCIRDKIIEMFGDLPRIELFARQKTEGWDVWGNEVYDSMKVIPSKTNTQQGFFSDDEI